MVIFNIRLRDCPGVFLVAQLTYCVQGFLSAQDKDITFEQLPTYVNILLVAFSGGCFAEINQLITGFSKVCTKQRTSIELVNVAVISSYLFHAFVPLSYALSLLL